MEVRVTPFVGVWIETLQKSQENVNKSVTPFVGVWIETNLPIDYFTSVLSHPSWVCGLKQQNEWSLNKLMRHTLRGCVD